MSDETNTLEAQTHVATSRLRQRQGRRMVWVLLAFFGLLLTTAPILFYVYWQAYGRSLLRAEIEAIRSQGEPLTTAQLENYFTTRQTMPDRTAAWLAVVMPFEKTPAITNPLNLPIMGSAKLPPLDQPWPDAAAVKEYFTVYQQPLAALHAVAKEGGVVHPNRDFSRGYDAMVIVEVQAFRATLRALMLQLQQQLRDQDAEAAIENLETQFALVYALSADPYLMSCLLRVAFYGVAFDSVRQTVDALPLRDDQLAHLQQLVRSVEIRTQIHDTLVAERGLLFRTFHLPAAMLTGETTADDDAKPRETHEEVYGVARPEDCATALSLMSRLIATVETDDASVMLDVTEQLDDELEQLKQEGGWIPNRFRFMQTNQLVISPMSVAQLNARTVALRELTDSLLAMHRYRLAHAQPPTTLGELAPQYLSQVPLDPFDGNPLRLVRKDNAASVYSIGQDRIDDGGVNHANRMEPDMVLELKAAR